MIKNASQKPQVYYGLHMVEGVAEYKDPKQNNGNPYRILICENTIKNMDATFTGRPVYVQHVADVNLENLHNEADGYVVESFFNKSDGKHWARFIIVSDKGHEAVAKGWKLSNAYIPKGTGQGGQWHGVDYAKEIMDGEYDHLAIVPNPRYAESVIMTPEEFKKYNNEKEIELTKLANSKEEKKSMLNIFKRSKVENSADLESMSVTLPRSKKEKSILQIVNELDEQIMMDEAAASKVAAGEMPMADLKAMVVIGDQKMSVEDMIKKLSEMELASKAAPAPAAVENKEDPAKKDEKKDDKKVEEKKENEEDDKDKKKKDDEEGKKENHFEALKNAADKAELEKPIVLNTMGDKVAVGKSKYGSN